MREENGLSHIHSVKEMLLDERRLVSYVSLSKELCIHVNESKLLLAHILEEIRKSNENITLNVNYIISGLLCNNRARTVVCNETELTNLKSQFKTVFFQHLYSLCVGSPSTDNVPFMAINKFEDLSLCTGLVKSNLCIKRPAEEIGNLKINFNDVHRNTENKQNVFAAVPKKAKESKNELNSVGGDKVSKIQHSTSEPSVKAEWLKKDVSNSNGLQKVESKNNKNQKGIAGFFNKASATIKKPANGTQEIKQESNVGVLKSEKMDIDLGITTIQSKLDDNSKKINNTLDQIKKTAKLDKKRKRVLHVSDSESEEEKNDTFNEDKCIKSESEDEIPPTPLVNTVKITSGIVNPKKKRKMVDKTYTDEDGYILTKKEEVYESCSENEEETNVKENVKSINKVSPSKQTEVAAKEKNGIKNKKKLKSPEKGKQATLMNFFKKV